MQALSAPSPLARLALTPHRAFFTAGVLALLAISAWWAMVLARPGPAAYPPALVHGLMMPLGVFPLFMLGFLFTAGPRWLNVSHTRAPYPIALAYIAGVLLALIGFHLGGPWPAAGLALSAAAWSVAGLHWAGCLRRSKAADQRHAKRMLGAMVAGGITLFTAAFWFALGDGRLWIAARSLAVWAFLLPVFLIVSHRMLPFFTQSAMPAIPAWRPFRLLDLGLLGCGLLALGAITGWRWLDAPVAFAMSAGLAYTSWRWGLRASLANRLLAMLHLSFAWLAPALFLYGLDRVGVPVGAAPVHALGMGCFATMLVGFVTRVTLGHSGRPLVADNLYWTIYLGIHLSAALRVGLALTGVAGPWLHAVSGIWGVMMLLWAARVLPIYLRARADGQPG